jgi:2-dehydro-3-deoxyglucarate aldolase/4-hydroxy-2-oxoheptanedioate aldolase
MGGDVVLGSMVFEFFSPGIAQIMKLAGCEYIIYDMEHTGLGYETVKDQVAMCRGLDVVPMVRVPRSDYAYLARALDIGCEGVMVPMVNTADEAKSIVEACRYPPIGRRGAAFGFAHDHYEAGAPVDKIKHANKRNLVIAQIETEHGLENVEEIAAVEGIDVLWVGHFDLTNFLGIPGEFDNKIYKDALKRVVKAGRKHGKGLGFMASDETWAREYKANGFNMLAAGTDHGLLMAGVNKLLGSVREDVTERKKSKKSGK